MQLAPHAGGAIPSEEEITPYFQPIVDLRTMRPFAYEVLSRADARHGMPVEMFKRAAAAGLTWDLERSCRRAAVRKISGFEPAVRGLKYFINVSPEIFADPRFAEGFTLATLAKYALNQDNIVIEITERESIRDYEAFENLLRHYTSQGFQIALDDFGSGHSGLVTLVRLMPHYLKLDMEIVRGAHLDTYKQVLVRAIANFAANVDTKLIAEGVETWEELAALVRLGVRYAQGFLLGVPAPRPTAIAPEVASRFRELNLGLNHRLNDGDESIQDLILRGASAEARALTTEEMFQRFTSNPQLDHITLLVDGVPTGLVTRQHFYAKTSGPYGYPLHRNKPVAALAKHDPLVVEETIHVTTLAKLAMERAQDSLYDPVVVVGSKREFLGTVTMRQLISRSIELEVQSAQGASPLTGLPGNRAIEKWLAQAVRGPEFTIVYADLSHFKEYNDIYGFLRGDEMIRLCASVLTSFLPELGPGARVGHIGGDDFVVVSAGLVSGDVLSRICQRFDESRAALFHAEHLDAGHFVARARSGETARIALVTLALAVLDHTRLPQGTHLAQIAAAAASLKRRAKEIAEATGRSTWYRERRAPGETLGLGARS